MANELLDFVISLVRDPDAAARYAADPGQTLADADLTGVTSADVNNLLPMVSDSLSMATPPPGAAGSADGNVWTSGAATAAFDAFTPHPALNDAVIQHPASPGVDASAHPEPAPVSAGPVHDYTSTFDGFDTSPQVGGAEAVHPGFDDGALSGAAIDHADHPDHASWGTWEHGHSGLHDGLHDDPSGVELHD